MKKPNGYWNYENCYEEAKKYKTRTEFQKGCKSAYKSALKHDWMNDYYWLKESCKQKPYGYWNYENCYAEALKYKTKRELEKSCGSAYNVARKNKWLDDYTWMVDGNILSVLKRTKWNKENCYAEALKYKTRTDFFKGCGSAYDAARKKGWLDDYTWFVDGKIKMLTDKNDSVYRYYWQETNAIYIGRTLISQQKIRHDRHSTSEKDTVFRYAKENGLEVPQMEIIEDNLTVTEGLEREDYWVNYYKEKGYNVLNKAKTGVGSGSLGAINKGKWNKKTVFEEAKKYKTRSEFHKNSSRAYHLAWSEGWLKEMDWLKEIIKPSGYWQNKENVFAEAKKYKTRTDFFKGCGSAYDAARKKGWLDILFPVKNVA